jgi:hypothetical protein
MSAAAPRYLLYDAPPHARLSEQLLYLERYAALARSLDRTLVLPRFRLHQHPQAAAQRIAGFTRGGIPLPAIERRDDAERTVEELAASGPCRGPDCAGDGSGADAERPAPLARWSSLFNRSKLSELQPVVELGEFFRTGSPSPMPLVLVGWRGCSARLDELHGWEARGWEAFNRARLPVSAVWCSAALPGLQPAEEATGDEWDPMRWEPSRSHAPPEEWDFAVLQALRANGAPAIAFALRNVFERAYHGTSAAPAPRHLGATPNAMPALEPAALSAARAHLRLDGRFYAAAELLAARALGGEQFVAIHWRRSDFLEVRANVSGALQSAHSLVRHARRLMKRLGVRRAYLATDSTHPAELAHVVAKLRPVLLSHTDFAADWAHLAEPLLGEGAAGDVGVVVVGPAGDVEVGAHGVGVAALPPAEHLSSLALSAAAAMLDVAVCARAAYFLGSATSQFSRQVLEERLAVFGHAPTTAAALGDDHSVSVARAPDKRHAKEEL